MTPSLNAKKKFDRVTPRGGITFLPTPTTSVYFTYSQGFRIPNVNELFAFAFSSNPNLQAVRSNNYEFGGKAELGKWGDVSIALFQSDIRDEIFFTCILCDFSFGDGINRNLDKTRRRGVELTLNITPVEFFDGTINYTYTEAHFRSTQIFGSGGASRTASAGDSFPLVPQNRVSVIGNFHPGKQVTVSLIGLYVSSQFLQNDEANSLNTLPSYFVVNGRAAYKRQVPGGLLNVFLQVNNLFDTEYFTRGIYASDNLPGGDGSTVPFVMPAPGIGVFGGINYQFNAFSG